MFKKRKKEFVSCFFSPDASSKRGHILGVIAATWHGNDLEMVEWISDEETRNLLLDVTKAPSLRGVLANLNDYFKEASVHAAAKTKNKDIGFWEAFFEQIGSMNFSFTNPAESHSESLKELFNRQIHAKEERLVPA